MRAKRIDESGFARGVAEREQILAEYSDTQRGAIAYDLVGHHCRKPVLPQRVAHWSAGPTRVMSSLSARPSMVLLHSFPRAKGLNIGDMKPSNIMRTGTLFSISAAIFVALACSKSGTAQEVPDIKVGIVYSFTGTGAPTDKQFDDAIAAWVKQHGDSAGGRKIV